MIWIGHAASAASSELIAPASTLALPIAWPAFDRLQKIAWHCQLFQAPSLKEL